MASPILEQQALDVDVTCDDAPEDTDPAYVGVAKVTYTISELLQALAEVDGDRLPDVIDQDYVDELEAAFRAGQSILEHPEHETIKRDMSALDAETLRDLRGTVGYVSAHLGLEVDLPAPAGGGEAA